MEPYLINGPRKAGPKRRKKNMARRNKKGQFVKGSKRKVRRSRKARRVVAKVTRRRKTHRRRHTVGAYTAHRHKRVITLHPRKKKWRVRQHMSNPVMGDVTDNLIAVGVLFGTLFAVGFLNRQAEKLPLPQSQWTGLAVKLGVAIGAAWGGLALAFRSMGFL